MFQSRLQVECILLLVTYYWYKPISVILVAFVLEVVVNNSMQHLQPSFFFKVCKSRKWSNSIWNAVVIPLFYKNINKWLMFKGFERFISLGRAASPTTHSSTTQAVIGSTVHLACYSLLPISFSVLVYCVCVHLISQCFSTSVEAGVTSLILQGSHRSTKRRDDTAHRSMLSAERR